MSKRRVVTALLAVVLVLVSLYVSGLVPAPEARFRSSGWAAYPPAMDEEFNAYIEESRRRIRHALEESYYALEVEPFGPGYSLEKVVSMRAPFEMAPDAGRCDTAGNPIGRGFLLLHGLADSPYLLSELAASLADRYPCARIRSLLMPGHGTVPGDLLDVRLTDWQQTVQYGVESFDGMVDELYLVGYSNGAALAIDYIQQRPRQSAVDGLILLSPGLAASRASIALTPYLKYLLRWVSKGPDRDAAKYDSMATNAAALFYRLTRKVAASRAPALEIPVLMAMSGDDTTVDTGVAAEYYCSKITGRNSKLIWYRSKVTEVSPEVQCPGLEIVELESDDGRFVTHSHVAIAMPPDNEHYGLDGLYSICTAYSDAPELLDRCNTDNDSTVYGENSLYGDDRLYQGKVLRRASFNPLYEELMSDIVCFIDKNCL